MKHIKNIIIVNDNTSIKGGADAVAISSAIGLAKRGLNVIFFGGTYPIDKNLENSGVEVLCLGMNDILTEPNRCQAIVDGVYNRKAKNHFQNILKQYNTNDTIVHIHTWTKLMSSSIFGLAQKNDFQIVLTLHDYFAVCPNGGLYNFNKQEVCLVKPLSIKCLLTNCDLRHYAHKQWRVIRQIVQNIQLKQCSNLNLIAVSNKVAEIIGQYMPIMRNKIRILYNPINILKSDVIKPNTHGKYLFMGRLAKEKGPDLFCEAITRLNLKGIVIGNGYMYEDLQKKYTNIEFSGWLSDNEKMGYIKNCKCLISSSKCYETFGLVVAEMKALGIPSIVPKESAAAEQIKDSYDGLYYEIGNLQSLMEAITAFESMDIQNISDNVVNSFNPQMFSIEGHLNNLLELYDSILQK